MRIECRITKATNTHPEYIILINFPWPQWLRGRDSQLLYTYFSYHLYILILSSHVGLWQVPPIGLFFSGYSPKYSVVITHHPVACYMTHLLLLCYIIDLIAPAFGSTNYVATCYAVFSRPLVASSVSGPNIPPVTD